MKYSQIQRFLLIDRLLYLNTEGISTKEMLKRINDSLREDECAPITLRQLQNDINDMKGVLNAPISSGRGQRKIKYSEVNFCIFNKTHEPYKLATLEDAMSGRLNWLRLQMDFMQESFYNEKMLEVIDYEDNLQLSNIDSLPLILKAITKERLIKFQYARRFSSEKESRIVHPYFLHQYNNRWYLFAFRRMKENQDRYRDKERESADGIRCYALDRMSEISIMNELRYKYESISAEQLRAFKRKYFSHIVGVENKDRKEIVDMDLFFNYGTNDENINNVVLFFFNLLKSNPFYEGFRFEENTDNGFARARIRPNPELENHLMMYAHTAYIDNDKIRENIIKRAKQILSTQHAEHQPK